jgi:hypothetical protein
MSASEAWLAALTPDIFAVIPLDPDRAVVKLDLHGVRLETLFVVGISTAEPRVSWPKSARGFPIVWIKDPAHRDRIETEILKAVADELAAQNKPWRQRASTT